MKFGVREGELTICLSGRVDSSSAEATEQELLGICKENEYTALTLDANALEYISSAGLRVILRLRKNEPSLRIINASPDVYDVFEMTGFTEMIPVEKAFRRLSVDGCSVIGSGAKGTVYRLDAETIIKVYKNPDSLPDIKNERELARKAFILGIPTAIPYDVVRVGESYGSVFELLNAKSFSQMIAAEPENIDHYVTIYAQLLRQIHQTMVKEDDMPDIKGKISQWLKADKEILSAEAYEKLEKLIQNVPDTLNMLHCDYHTNNIMMQNGETLLIDMDTLSHGHPIFELANIYITYVGFGISDPTIVERFIGLPYETAKEIWKKFLPIYLDTEDEARIAEVEAEVKLLSDVRLMRHFARRGGMDTEEGRKLIALCKDAIENAVQSIDTLTF